VLDNIQAPISNHSVKSSHETVKQTESPAQKENNEFSFEDILDVLNPLHHIPIVSKVYKEQAEDDISNDAKSVGDMLYGVLTGGIFGGLTALGNALVRQETDKDITDHVIAFVSDEDKSKDSLRDINIDRDINPDDEVFASNESLQYLQNKDKQTEINPKADF